MNDYMLEELKVLREVRDCIAIEIANAVLVYLESKTIDEHKVHFYNLMVMSKSYREAKKAYYDRFYSHKVEGTEI